MTKSRLKKYLKAKIDPAYATLEKLEEVEEITENVVKSVMQNIESEVRHEMKEKVREIISQLPKIENDIRKRVTREVKKKVMRNKEEFTGPKGEKGEQGKKGEQGPKGEKGEPGEDGYTPVSGVDYPIAEDIDRMIEEKMPENASVVGEIVEEYIKQVDVMPTAADIARGIEDLPEEEKLDYYRGLKNRPRIPQSDESKGILRGGGEKMENYDLSDDVDGNTKTFTIPANKKVVGLFGTDFPTIYRPDTDFTTSGSDNRTLTLTDEVPAPSEDATLYIIYVP